MSKNFQLFICGVENNDLKILQTIQSADVIIAREEIATRWLESIRTPKFIQFSLDMDKSLKEWTLRLFADRPAETRIVYVTPFNTAITDSVLLSILEVTGTDHVEFNTGRDYSLDLIRLVNNFSPSSLILVDGLLLVGMHHPPFSADDQVLIYAPGGSAAGLEALLGKIFKTDHSIFTLFENSNHQLEWQSLSLGKLHQVKKTIFALFIPSASKDHSLESFQEVIAHLRAPEDGCPWDMKQTHSSLRTYLLEETYEALDALDKKDVVSLKEELGDILLQILLHAQIASEAQEFTMADVISGINRKIVYRHPHVFKDWVVTGEEDVVQNWESLKGQERLKKGGEDKKGMLDGVPISFPALAQAQAIQDRAARVGFDWPDIAPVMDKVVEELEEVKTAQTDEERAKELGDVLFAIVNVIRWYKVDAESALRLTNLKFRKRFSYIEEQARAAGRDLQKMSLDEMDKFWEQAKEFDE